MKKNTFIALLFIGGLTACNDSDNEQPENLESVNIFVCSDKLAIPNALGYPVTNFSQIKLSEIKTGDAQPVTLTQTYDYEAGRIASFTSLQKFVAGGESFEIENITDVVHEDHKVIVTDEINNVSTYTLNDKGYAVSCVRQEMDGKVRSYTFSYLTNTVGKYFLKNITETLNGGRIYSTINIDYNNYRALRITQQIDVYEQTYIASTPADNEIANTSEIPYLFLTDLYPLSFHSVAIYGKFLGDAYNTLITNLSPEDNSESNETTTYKYKFDGRGIVTSCDEVTKSYGDDYKRTIKYTIE